MLEPGLRVVGGGNSDVLGKKSALCENQRPNLTKAYEATSVTWNAPVYLIFIVFEITLSPT